MDQFLCPVLGVCCLSSKDPYLTVVCSYHAPARTHTRERQNIQTPWSVQKKIKVIPAIASVKPGAVLQPAASGRIWKRNASLCACVVGKGASYRMTDLVRRLSSEEEQQDDASDASGGNVAFFLKVSGLIGAKISDAFDSLATVQFMIA